MEPEELKVPKKRPSIIDQVNSSRFSVGRRPGKYLDGLGRIKGLETGAAGPIRKPAVLPPPAVTDNDYVENYVDDYFE
jgi:hypothetical protein